MKHLRIPAVILLALGLAACNLAQITQLINAAVLIAEQAAAITGVIPPAAVNYLSAASNCVASIATEQATTDSAIVKYDKDFAACSMYVSVSLPPGTPQNVLDKASQLAASIADILANLKPAAVNTTARATQEKPMSADDITDLKKAADRAKAAAQKVASR